MSNSTNDLTDLEQYLERVKRELRDNEQILKVTLRNRGTFSPAVHLEPEGNWESLEPGSTFELVLVVSKDNPRLHLTFLSNTDFHVMPDSHGAIFQDGKGVVNF